MPRYKEDEDLPTKDELAHLPHAYQYGFSDFAIRELIYGMVTARATHTFRSYAHMPHEEDVPTESEWREDLGFVSFDLKED
jgi:hypothetical protein